MPIISFKEYKEKFERLIKDVNISKIEFDSTIKDLIFQTPLGAMQLNYTPFLIRTSLLGENEACAKVARCSYVPDSMRDSIPMQRCNFKKQQVFYASIAGGMKNFSDGAQPSLMETVVQRIIDDPSFDGRVAAASKWQIKQQPVFWFLSHRADSIANNENFKYLFNHFDKVLRDNSSSGEHYKGFTEKLNYLSELFCKDYDREKTYEVTATYYNKVMELFKPFNNSYDALIYPSANTRGEGMNIVLTKDYVDKQNIYCDLVVLYTINRNPNNPKNIWFVPFAQATPDKFGNLDFKPLDKDMFN